jgi:signal transduction histidine kinase
MITESAQQEVTKVLAEVASAVVGKFEMRSLLNQIISTTMKTLNAEVCSIFLEDKEKEPGYIRCVAGSGFAKRVVDKAVYKIGEGFTGMVAKTGEGYISQSRQEHEARCIENRIVWRGKFDHLQWPSGQSEFRNGIALPLKIKDQILGVIKVENKLRDYGDHFIDDEFRLFETIANVVALTIENARLHVQIEKQLKTIASMAAHRINNQLTNYDEIELELEEQATLPVPDKQKLDDIRNKVSKATKNLKRMVSELKTYGKPLSLVKKLSDINQIVDNECILAEKASGLKIIKRLGNGLPQVELDDGRFAEAIKELIHNSIKAISKVTANNASPDIIVETKLSRHSVGINSIIVSISDNGPGFKTGFPIFQPFQSTDPQSTGLGLVTVLELSVAHGWEINARNRECGGAIVTINIPI